MEEKEKLYEIAFLLKSEEGLGNLITYLKRFGAEILNEGEIRKIKLAYPIKHLVVAFFGYTHFKLNPQAVIDLRNALKLDEQVIRFLVITPPFAKENNQRLPSSPSRFDKRVAKPEVELSQKPELTISNDLLEEKLEEILNKP